jgi:hypothetical protein
MVEPTTLGNDNVVVLPHREVVGANSLEEFAGQLDPQLGISWPSIEEAFEHHWGSDAYFVGYLAKDSPTGPFIRTPRVNKACLPHLRTSEVGGDLLATLIAFDLDTADHTAWTGAEQRDAYAQGLAEACRKDPGIACFWAFYFTNKGARLVYRLTIPVPVDQVEGIIVGMIARLEAAGVTPANGTFKVDPACADWTRVFRLPRVVRDGRPTWTDDFTSPEYQPEARLDPKTITPVGRPSGGTVAAAAYQGEIPDDGILVDLAEGKKLAKWVKKAKQQLTGDESHDVIWRVPPRLLAEKGERNNALHRVVGQCCTRLVLLDDTTPEAIYGLLLPAVRRFAQDEREPWEVTLWKAVCKWWATEQAKLAQEHAQRATNKEQAQVEKLSIFEQMTRGMRAWCKNPELNDPTKAPGFILRRLIASPGNYYHVLRPDGLYDPHGVTKDLLIPTMRHLQLDKVVDLEWMNDKGKVQRLKGQEALDQYSLRVMSVEGCPARPGFEGGTIEESSLGGGTTAKLHIPLFGLRTDIHPAFRSEVDGWIRAFGRDEVWVRDFIWGALNAGIMPIFSIHAPHSIGKKLIARGLAECITTQTTASDRDFGTFSPMLMESPFLIINEGLEERVGGKEASAIARHLSGGDPQEINRKYRVPVVVRNPVRIMVFANNDDVVLDLVGGNRDMTPHDREALFMRLIHLDVDDAPAKYLESLGGMKHTAKPGARWIQGDDGAPSDHIVASHFLWLAKNHKPTNRSTNGRFLLKGHVPDHLRQRLHTRSGSSPVVIETIIRMIEVPSFVANGDIVYMAGGRVAVSASAIIEAHRNDTRAKRELNHKNVGSVLRSLKDPDTPNYPRVIQTPKGPRNQRWTEIDLKTLLSEAQEHGYRHEVLRGLVEGAGTKSKNEVEDGDKAA